MQLEVSREDAGFLVVESKSFSRYVVAVLALGGLAISARARIYGIDAFRRPRTSSKAGFSVIYPKSSPLENSIGIQVGVVSLMLPFRPGPLVFSRARLDLSAEVAQRELYDADCGAQRNLES
jgi:hypothetical protein